MPHTTAHVSILNPEGEPAGDLTAAPSRYHGVAYVGIYCSDRNRLAQAWLDADEAEKLARTLATIAGLRVVEPEPEPEPEPDPTFYPFEVGEYAIVLGDPRDSDASAFRLSEHDVVKVLAEPDSDGDLLVEIIGGEYHGTTTYVEQSSLAPLIPRDLEEPEPAAPTFAPGPRVRVVSSGYLTEGLRAGATGTVESLDRNGCCRVRLDRGGRFVTGNTWCYLPHELEIVRA